MSNIEQDDDIITCTHNRKALRTARARGGMVWLVAELTNRLNGSITRAHLTELMEELLAVYGDPDDAAEALRSGKVRVDKFALN
jgi:hypothetical protein